MKRYSLRLGLLGIALTGCMPPPPLAIGPAQVFEVYFGLGAVRLDERALNAIDHATVAAGRRPTTVPVEVIGHADAVGGAQTNSALSQARAQAVAAALAREGVARERIILRAAGEGLPAVATGPDEREPRNRRVEIIIR